MNALLDQIFAIQSEEEFNQLALEVFAFQVKEVPVYREFVQHLNRPAPVHFTEIPHLPIGFFKSHEIIVSDKKPELVFKSSGTTGMQRSAHLVADATIYQRSFLPTYEHFVGPCADQIILALLPNYVQQGESSLVYMVEKLIERTKHELSGFYLDDFTALNQAVITAKSLGKRVVVFGVSYALLDFAATKPDLSGVTVIETGGMKGRRKEMSKAELHLELIKGFSCEYIASEYGMCELLSQGYSNAAGLFELPPWMRVQLRDIYDPFTQVSPGKTGGVNVIDLANIYSCAFIETEDLGRLHTHEHASSRQLLQLMGRIDRSDIRGCNLLVS